MKVGATKPAVVILGFLALLGIEQVGYGGWKNSTKELLNSEIAEEYYMQKIERRHNRRLKGDFGNKFQRSRKRLNHLKRIEHSLVAADITTALQLSIGGGFERIAAVILAQGAVFDKDTEAYFIEIAVDHDLNFPEEPTLSGAFAPGVGRLSKKHRTRLMKKLAHKVAEVSSPEAGDLYQRFPALRDEDTRFSRDSDGNTPLMLAAAHNNQFFIFDEIDEASKKLINVRNRFGWSLIHIAAAFADYEVIVKVLEKEPELHYRIYSARLNRKCTAADLLQTNENLSPQQVHKLKLKMQNEA